MRIKIFYQHQRYGCGIAAIKMVREALYHDQRSEDLREIDATTSAPSLADLLSYGESIGVSFQALHGALTSACSIPNLILIDRGSGSHLVVYGGFDGRRHIIIDPSLGRLYLEGDRLAEIYLGVYLMPEAKPVPVPGLREAGKKTKERRRSQALDIFIYALPNLIMMLGMLLLLLLPEQPYIAIICFISALIAVVASRFHGCLKMQRLDRRYAEGSEINTQSFANLCACKLTHASYPTSLVTEATSLLTVALVALRSPLFALTLAIAIALYCLWRLSISRKLRYLASDISDLEQSLLGDVSDRRDTFLTISDYAAAYQRYLISSEVIYICLAILSVLASMLLAMKSDTIEVLVFLGLAYYCLSSVHRAYALPSLYANKRKEESALAEIENHEDR